MIEIRSISKQSMVRIKDTFVTRSLGSRGGYRAALGKAGLAGIESVIEDFESGSLPWNDPGPGHEQPLRQGLRSAKGS
jgi:hypothetical protein